MSIWLTTYLERLGTSVNFKFRTLIFQVFGLANQHIRAGVFSFARYDDSFWSEEKTSMEDKNWDKILYRAVKVMTHEIGHMFGLKHCVHF